MARFPTLAAPIGLPAFIVAAFILHALAALTAPDPASAADPKTWPFNEKAPRDPALGLLQKVEGLNVQVTGINPKLLSIEVEAMAPRPGYTDVTLVDRPSKLRDRIFAFELRGRPPQKPEEEENPTELTAGGTYEDAPIGEIDVIEIYAEENCLAYSLAEDKAVDCTSRVLDDESF